MRRRRCAAAQLPQDRRGVLAVGSGAVALAPLPEAGHAVGTRAARLTRRQAGARHPGASVPTNSPVRRPGAAAAWSLAAAPTFELGDPPRCAAAPPAVFVDARNPPRRVPQ